MKFNRNRAAGVLVCALLGGVFAVPPALAQVSEPAACTEKSMKGFMVKWCPQESTDSSRPHSVKMTITGVGRKPSDGAFQVLDASNGVAGKSLNSQPDELKDLAGTYSFDFRKLKQKQSTTFDMAVKNPEAMLFFLPMDSPRTLDAAAEWVGQPWKK
ncbi:hypothetical protein GCM10010329_86210 [Streptomyces spiroverticillatus]|uniref:Uncharacterized protein n=1 Tax=Streptomyces finlayi TaxID=67296 RepID=A0A918X9L8_9ACTN|nr:hypothetical protein [Streptomyces finlayi]GHA50998.1 hypothetical protein GCM10010329_86210 [Streptomyces spiroverticillatus]GHD20065.1 hypothetical protein GCM10010334_84270 [Streptomyces finlayi]